MNTQSRLCQSPADLVALLAEPTSPALLVPDLVELARDPARVQGHPGTALVRGLLAPYLADVAHVPHTTYTLYREFRRTGERRGYQAPMTEKRAKLCAAAFEVLLGDPSLLDTLQDYIWDVCEETNWVMPAHEDREIDLGAVATGLSLAEIAIALGDRLAEEVVARIRSEIERRIFEPYLARHEKLSWFRGHNNWNGVCNSAIGAMFLLLEPDVDRAAQALALVLEGLDVFLSTAFEADGGSTEGVSYWQYGLSNLIPFGEMLRLRTGGAIDILGSERLRQVASYPTRMMLSAGHYANFSDCEEIVPFAPGLTSRLAERTGVTALYDVLVESAPLVRETNYSRFHNLWRNIAWWDGTRPDEVTIQDTWSQDVGVARLVGTTPWGAPVVLAAKAGHNAENHNQNDVGSFLLHVDGESLICEPGRGLYSRDYFSPRRYENVFASSFGHSVPRVDGQLQSPGRTYRGQITAYEEQRPQKQVVMSIGDAYQVPGLSSLTRTLTLDDGSGVLTLEDRATFDGQPLPLEEAFVTWSEVTVSGMTARIVGERAALELQIAAPAGAVFVLEVLEEASAANAKPVPLKRLSFGVPPTAGSSLARVVVSPSRL